MKTAISIPDDLFDAGERTAERLGVSRSALYRRALRRLLADLDDDAVTAGLDAVFSEERADGELDPALAALQASSLEAEDW